MTDTQRRTRVKMCGLARPEEVQAAAALGVDAIGLVFCEASPRHLALDQAAALARATPGFVSLVALFLNPDRALVEQVLSQVQPELLQFHGTESPQFCGSFGRRYLKAVSMAEGLAAARRQMRAHARACAYVLDSHILGQVGGTGRAFDWSELAADAGAEAATPLVLAGGLDPGNVGRAIAQARPYAVDVSSGIESAPGIKSRARMADFMRGVRAADAQRSAGSE